MECVVCCERLSGEATHEHAPILLACGHTLCRRCVTVFHSTGLSLCPICRAPMSADNRDWSKSVNEAVLGLVHTQGTDEVKAVQCGNCDSKPATKFCAKCEVDLCDNCFAQIHSLKAFQGHVAAPRSPVSKCGTHNVAFIAQCMDCAKPVCGLCFVADAPCYNHETKSLADAAAAEAASLQVAMAAMREDQKAVNTALDRQTRARAECEKSLQATITIVRESFAQLRQDLDVREQQLIEQVKDDATAKLKQLQLQQSNLEMLTRCFQTLLEQAEDLSNRQAQCQEQTVAEMSLINRQSDSLQKQCTLVCGTPVSSVVGGSVRVQLKDFDSEVQEIATKVRKLGVVVGEWIPEGIPKLEPNFRLLPDGMLLEWNDSTEVALKAAGVARVQYIVSRSYPLTPPKLMYKGSERAYKLEGKVDLDALWRVDVVCAWDDWDVDSTVRELRSEFMSLPTAASLPLPRFEILDLGVIVSGESSVKISTSMNGFRYAISDVLPHLPLVSWRLKVHRLKNNDWIACGIISNNTAGSESCSSPTSFAWANPEICINGKSTNESGWLGWRKGDEAIMELNRTACTLRMRLRRTNQVYALTGLPQDVDWRIQVNFYFVNDAVEVRAGGSIEQGWID